MERLEEVLQFLEENRNEKNRAGMERFGIRTDKAFGISVKELRSFAKKYKKDHDLAVALWETEYHESRLLASLIEDPTLITEGQLDGWVDDFDSWDVCDLTCMNVIIKSRFRTNKLNEWAENEKEFTRRTAFTMIAVNAVHNKDLNNKDFESFFDLIRKYSTDERNFVKKAVNWGLRQIGKRNFELNKKAIIVAEELAESGNKAARWIGKDTVRELTNTKIQSMLERKAAK